MRRLLVPVLITCVAAGLVCVWALGLADQNTSSSIDAQVARGHYPLAPDLDTKLPLISSKGRESLAMLRGKVVLVNIFASWCDSCAEEAPVLERAEHLLSHHDGTVLGVTYLDNSVDSLAFMRKHHVSYPVVQDVNGNLVHAFGTYDMPESFVINRNGHIQALRRYTIDNQWVNQTLPKIWSEAS